MLECATMWEEKCYVSPIMSYENILLVDTDLSNTMVHSLEQSVLDAQMD